MKGQGSWAQGCLATPTWKAQTSAPTPSAPAEMRARPAAAAATTVAAAATALDPPAAPARAPASAPASAPAPALAPAPAAPAPLTWTVWARPPSAWAAAGLAGRQAG
eukprot:scaffold261179_cov24-Tisochrysis_lutea.AAC.3